MSKNLRIVGLVSAFALLVLGLIPKPSLAATDWHVVVVDERDQPVEGILVRETWQNFAFEKQGHVSERTTDATGRAHFPRKEPSILSCANWWEPYGLPRASIC